MRIRILAALSCAAFAAGCSIQAAPLSLTGTPPHAAISPTPTYCESAAVSWNADYSYAVASAGASGQPDFQWLANSLTLGDPAPVNETLFLAFDDPLDASLAPAITRNAVDYAAGKWGRALALGPGGALELPAAPYLPLAEGSVEFWIAAEAGGDDPRYRQDQSILFYSAPNGDTFMIAQAGESGVLFLGGMAGGEWQSAYGDAAHTHTWKAGEWHHVLAAWSAAGNHMRFYLDGRLIADSNEGRYRAPSAAGDRFLIGGATDKAPAYRIDSLRISRSVPANEEIAARASRISAPAANEVWLPATGLAEGAEVQLRVRAGERDCLTRPVAYHSAPVRNPDPPSTLLPPGSTSVELSVETTGATACGYSIGADEPFSDMIPFSSGGSATLHKTVIRNLDPDTNRVNRVFVRCAAQPDFLLPLSYRALPAVNPTFPRTGNLWGQGMFLDKGLDYMARIDLWLGADLSPDQIRTMRGANPDILILSSINAVENKGLPDDYYLKDIHGERIEVWPGSFRLNLTKSYVADYQARLAYRLILENDLLYDGMFFDNVMTTQSWQKTDIYGDEFLVDSDEDGIVDDPAEFDAAWNAGVFHEIREFRRLMPHAVTSGHSMRITEPGIADLFNGLSVGFATTDALEGKISFQQVWDEYHRWMAEAPAPRITMFEASPPDMIAYGYDYSPWEKIPESTLEFARTYFRYMRFGLGLTLMDDGYYAYEFGDTWHGNDWWYDELDFDLGYPLGPAERVAMGDATPSALIPGGDFETDDAFAWGTWVDEENGYRAVIGRDATLPGEGASSARVEVRAAPGEDWRIILFTGGVSLEKGGRYDVTFLARADPPRTISLGAQKGSPDWDGYGLRQVVNLTPEWTEYTVSFESTGANADARLEFMFGESAGTVWIDAVRIGPHPADVFRREFENGLVVLNASREARIVALDRAWRKLSGDQAPLWEVLLDDGDPSFSTNGLILSAPLDSGEWKAAGPFYHSWGGSLHLLPPGATAEWIWRVPADDTYSIDAWWPAAPAAGIWNTAARYEVWAGGVRLASIELDQTRTGDEWHRIADLWLPAGKTASIRLVCAGVRICAADALFLRSAARWNDGSLVQRIFLPAMDAILLRRD